MKFTPEHYQTLKSCIKEVIQLPILQKGEKSETRYLWDIFWASGWSHKFNEQYHEGDYLDSHIQTAVKNIVKELI